MMDNIAIRSFVVRVSLPAQQIWVLTTQILEYSGAINLLRLKGTFVNSKHLVQFSPGEICTPQQLCPIH